MLNATWSKKGLEYIPSAICCEDHYTWHEMNCGVSHLKFSGTVADIDKLKANEYNGQLSEYLF